MYAHISSETEIFVVQTPLQITCLYDMDIVFQPNGNFDEVYLYVGLLLYLLSGLTHIHTRKS